MQKISRSNAAIATSATGPNARRFLGARAALSNLLVSLGWSCLICSNAQAGGPQPAFRTHVINAESTFCACAAIDVNRDGRLDIVCGGWWYEAPSWKRHFVREVEFINGRYDDFSHLPMDVNGDGWTDIVSANYRSRSLYWVEHPGRELGPWARRVIEVPGPMETARLVDVDGDGQLDVLPNCVKTEDGRPLAAWWELIRTPATETPPSNTTAPRWVRHDLPGELAGHGIGFGDLNGDGRGDMVGPRGWLEAPEDRRAGRWLWHPDFSLDRDCSIPILVQDVDEDGDNDLVWGRGHNIGVYWLEQVTTAQAAQHDTRQDAHTGPPRTWIRHAIDTSWSQSHSLLWVDLNDDGRSELVTGKRYLGHEGRDPGEYDPLVVYAYEFSIPTRTWHRSLISAGGGVGFGLDPKATDLDADGDLDLLACGRSGLYWLENLGTRAASPSSVAGSAQPGETKEPADPYPNHTQLMVFRDDAGSLTPVRGPFDWSRRRADVLQGLERAMGPLPDPSRRVPLDLRITASEKTAKYVRHSITFRADLADALPGDRVPAYLLIPHADPTAAEGQRTVPRPAMLCLHQTTGIGKGEPAGLGGLPNLHYAHELAERGFVCLVPDYPSFGDYAFDFKTQGQHYASGSMKAIWNNLRAVDVLESLPEVDRDRIGCIGHSLGGHNALFTAVFDQRLRAIVTSCGFTAFHHYYEGKLEGWTSDRYMPRIRDVYGSDPDRVPFDFYEVLAALAPRPVYVSAPEHDDNFDLAGVKKVVEAAREIFELRGAADQLRAVYPDCEHDFPADVRHAIYAWLDERFQVSP